jgi:hypothetical protein
MCVEKNVKAINYEQIEKEKLFFYDPLPANVMHCRFVNEFFFHSGSNGEKLKISKLAKYCGNINFVHSNGMF